MTQGNKERRYIGRTDEPLCEEGKKQLMRLRDVLGSWDEKNLYLVSSPMKRCMETTKILFPKSVFRVCDHLRETDFGLFEGKNYEELKELRVYQQWIDSNGALSIQGAEDHNLFVQRVVKAFLEEIHRMNDLQLKKGAFIIHGGCIMGILEKLSATKESFYHWQIGNGNGYIIQLDDSLVIQSIEPILS